MSDVRDRIARVIYESLSGKYGDFAWPGDAADALLAEFPVLAGTTDEAVEAGALALVRHVEGGRPPRPVSAHARELARVVLESVIEKEQADERG